MAFAVLKETRHRCPSCGARMERRDVPWTADLWRGAGRPELGMVLPPDGRVYSTGTRYEGRGRAERRRVAYQHRYRWVHCDRCRVCYLADDAVLAPQFSARSQEDWEARMEELRNRR